MKERVSQREKESRVLGLNPKEQQCNFVDNRLSQPIIQKRILHDGKRYYKNGDRMGGFWAAIKRMFLTQSGEDICHKLSFDEIQSHIVDYLENSSLELSSLCDVLNDGKVDTAFNELKLLVKSVPPSVPKILEKANDLLKKMNNSPGNLRKGKSTFNRSIKNHCDPHILSGRSASPTSKKLYPYSSEGLYIRDGKVITSEGAFPPRSFTPDTRKIFKL